jgi:hypothetical protein
MRPITASAALRHQSPRKSLGVGSFPPLRNNSVRDESPARQRIGSFKRKPDGSISYANAARSNVSNVLVSSGISSEKLEEMSVDISKVSSLCDKIDTSVRSVEDENIKNILADISVAIRLVNNNQEVIVKCQLGKINYAPAGNVLVYGSGSGMVSLGNIPKKKRSSVQWYGAGEPYYTGTGQQHSGRSFRR